MTRSAGRRGLLVATVVLAAGRLTAQDATAPSPSPPRRWAIGAGWSYIALEDTRRVTDSGPDNTNIRGNYLGSLWGLDAEQHAFPDPFVEYGFRSWFGVGASYEQQRAKTLDWQHNDPTLPPVGDGELEVRGAQLYAFGRYPNHTPFTPRATVGRARYWSRFFTLPSWNGGDPGKVLQVDDTWGWILSAGCRVALGRHAGLDVSYRRAQIGDVVARAYGDIIDNPDRYRKGAFPMRSRSLRLGIAYSF